jgi:hypothetical protein
VPIDIDEIFSRGGRELIDLLDHAVRAVQPDVLFIFLIREYRQAPTTPEAVALYEIFCAPPALARVSATGLLPPASHHLEVALRPLRLNLAQRQAAQASATVAPPLILPPKFLFDAIDHYLRKNSPGLRQLKRRYQLQRTPIANLPGGKMKAGQRHFVEKIWEPNLRPRLVAAGFRRVGSIA